MAANLADIVINCLKGDKSCSEFLESFVSANSDDEHFWKSVLPLHKEIQDHPQHSASYPVFIFLTNMIARRLKNLGCPATFGMEFCQQIFSSNILAKCYDEILLRSIGLAISQVVINSPSLEEIEKIIVSINFLGNQNNTFYFLFYCELGESSISAIPLARSFLKGLKNFKI